MDKWAVGVFASIDEGLGVSLDILKELNVPTIQIHAPSPSKRTAEEAANYLARLQTMGITVTAVFWRV